VVAAARGWRRDLGKTNLTEFANPCRAPAPSGYSSLGGQAQPATSTPRRAVLRRARRRRGGLATITIGTETSGRRQPVGGTGDAGLRPTVGLVSRTGIVPIPPRRTRPDRSRARSPTRRPAAGDRRKDPEDPATDHTPAAVPDYSAG
jgi:amidase